ncbi:Pyridoxal 5'-phosphate synthase subunit snz1 [Phlyctochytrium planicorne]|nr:Pyridoxal 5'-phosphate synthase subunit snz1 [Phlyctochytrium planicorne]
MPNFETPANLVPNGTANGHGNGKTSFVLKAGLAQNLKGGVIMDVVNAEQARIAEEAGACAVMALERVPADIRKNGGVARMSDPKMIKEIQAAVSIPVMAKVRIGHIVEAQILEAIGIDYIDESEVLTPADDVNHIDKSGYNIPFVCGCRNLGEALRRISEGAAMIRTKGEAGTGNVVEAVRHARTLMNEIRRVKAMAPEELYSYAKEIQAPIDLVKEVARLGRLPVVNFAAGNDLISLLIFSSYPGGVATPADAALMMQLGMDGVFVGSGIFKSGDPAKRARAIVQAVTHYNDAKVLAQVSEDLGEAMVGINCDTLPSSEQYAKRGWPWIRFALVVTFAGIQTDLVLRNVETIWPRKIPCDPKRGYGKTIDLIFYTNRLGAISPSHMKRLRESVMGNPLLSQCFRTVRFICARLSEEEDKYPYGPSHMFFKLFSNKETKPLLRAPGGSGFEDQPYQVMYYMEPDNIPCRSNWLDRLFEEASIPGDFWMRGSILRNRDPIVGTWSFANHMNGNALYRMDDPRFTDFVEVVRQRFWVDPEEFAGGYDVALYLVREDRNLVGWTEYASTMHLFQYTATIQNWYRTPVNATELCFQEGERGAAPSNEDTYLVHGKDVVL